MGEESLREMLDDVGLLEGVNYKWEDTVGSFDQKVKPDVYLDSTRGGTIVIDSKVSIASFAQSQNVESEEGRIFFRKQPILFAFLFLIITKETLYTTNDCNRY